jgi:adenylate cyclase class 2
MPGAAEARADVARIGAVPSRPRHLEDNVLYDDAARSLKASGRTLRLRRAAGEAIVTFKGPRIAGTGVKSRVEVEFAVADADAAHRTFLGLGYERVFRYQKYREAFTWRDAEILVDETPVGTFLEIEGPPATIHAAAAALGRGPADYVDEGYPEILAAAGRVGDMLFE